MPDYDSTSVLAKINVFEKRLQIIALIFWSNMTVAGGVPFQVISATLSAVACQRTEEEIMWLRKVCIFFMYW